MVADAHRPADEALGLLVDRLDRTLRLDIPPDRISAGLLGFGWWVRVLRTCEAVAVLHASDLGHEAAPLTRTAIHHLAALLWLAEDPGAVLAAVRHQHQQKQFKLAQSARENGWDLTGIDKLPKKPRTPSPTELEYLERAELLCDHVGLPSAYVAFQIESAFVHPSANGADAYLEPDANEETGLRLRTRLTLVTPLRSSALLAAHATKAFGTLVRDDDLVQLADRVGAMVTPGDTPPFLPTDD